MPSLPAQDLRFSATMPDRVLIVDDESAIRDILSEILLREGYIVETTSTGTAAIDAVRERRPDAVLLDLNIPGALDGRAVLRAIGGDVPVIVVTGINDPEDARATLQAGAFDFVAKPFDLNRVSELVAAAVVFHRGP